MKASSRFAAVEVDEVESCCWRVNLRSKNDQPTKAEVFGYGNFIEDNLCMSESTVHLGTKAHRAH